MVQVLLPLFLGLLLAVPLIWVARSDRKLTWTGAVVLATLIATISVLLIGEFPSRLLYWFDAEHDRLAHEFAFLATLFEGDRYMVVRDVVVNSVQGGLFVIIMVITYFWGERHRKAGRFRS